VFTVFVWEVFLRGDRRQKSYHEFALTDIWEWNKGTGPDWTGMDRNRAGYSLFRPNPLLAKRDPLI